MLLPPQIDEKPWGAPPDRQSASWQHCSCTINYLKRSGGWQTAP